MGSNTSNHGRKSVVKIENYLILVVFLPESCKIVRVCLWHEQNVFSPIYT